MTMNYLQENDPSDETPLVKNLRKLIEDRDKKLAEQDRVLTDLTGKVRTQSVSDVLRGIGFKPGLAKFVPTSVETSEDAIKAWLKENEDLFGTAEQKVDESSQQQQGQQVDTQAQNLTGTGGVTPEQQAAFQRMARTDTNTTLLPDIEQTQISQITAMAQASGDDYDTFMKFLRGERKLA